MLLNKGKQMTTDPNWLKSITESYTQEVSESARNLQEEAENLYNLVETIQTALNVDLTEAQVDALIEAFRSTIDPETGGQKPGLVRKVLRVLGAAGEVAGNLLPDPNRYNVFHTRRYWGDHVGLFGDVSRANFKKQNKISKEIIQKNKDIDAENTVLHHANISQDRAHNNGTWNRGLPENRPRPEEFKFSDYKYMNWGDV